LSYLKWCVVRGDHVIVNVPRLKPLHKHSLLLVHGFGVASCVFRPLLRRLNDVSTSAQLFRYPSVGLELAEIVARLSRHLRDTPPDSIIAHSLGCIASWFAVRDADWRGPIVLLAPPLKTLPLTRLIPSFARMPFAPLLDHRDLFTDPEFRLPTLPGCTIQTIAGRNDLLVPLSCTRQTDVTTTWVTMHTHNSMLFSPSVARRCLSWTVGNEECGEPSDAPESPSRAF
jgi:pimeloyl-ACP methyl ester carboxylesterase